MPAPLDTVSVFDAVIRLRRSTSHADGDRVHPENDSKCLTGFIMDANHDAPVLLREWELRNFGLLVAEQFAEQMRRSETS